MRITTKMVSRRVMKNLNNIYDNMQKYHTQASTGDKFQRASEDPINATRSMDIKNKMARAKQYGVNIHEAYSVFKEAEVSLKGITGSITSCKKDLLKALSGSYNDEDRAIIAEKVKTIRGDIIAQLNKEYAGKHIFGGFNTFEQPFTTSGNVTMYNTLDLETVTAAQYNDFLNEKIIIQTGKATEINNSVPGIEVTGYGPDNLISVMDDITTHLQTPGAPRADLEALVDKLDDHFTNVQNQVSKTGTKMSNLENLQMQNEDVNSHLEELLSEVQGVDMYEASINLKMSEMVYNSALSVGSKIIQPSLLDFLR